MSSSGEEIQPESVHLFRVYEAPLGFLFDCFTDPALVMQWWGPQGTLCPEATNDFRPGGSYRFAIEDVDSGDRYVSCGEYLVIEPPDRLVFTWYWEAHPEQVTRVSIDFRAIDAARTELTLVHDRFPSTESARSHEAGWMSSFECLGRWVAQRKSTTTGARQ